MRPGVVQERAAARGRLFPPGFPVRYGPDELQASATLLEPTSFSSVLTPGATTELTLTITHEGSVPWPSEKALEGWPFSVRFDVIFRRENQTRPNRRTQLPLPRTLYPGESFQLPIEIDAPSASGSYQLEIRIFQETGGDNPILELLSLPVSVQ